MFLATTTAANSGPIDEHWYVNSSAESKEMVIMFGMMYFL